MFLHKQFMSVFFLLISYFPFSWRDMQMRLFPTAHQHTHTHTHLQITNHRHSYIQHVRPDMFLLHSAARAADC